MKVMTYNIQWGKGRDGNIDLNRIAATVAGADVICLQEVERNWRLQDFPDQAQRLGELLPGYHWVYGAAVDLAGEAPGQRRQIGNMTLSRFPLTSTRNWPLPARPVQGHVNDQQAMLETVIEQPGFSARIYNTHLNYLTAEQRMEQARLVAGIIASAPEHGGPITAPGRDALGPDDEWIVLDGFNLPGMPEDCLLAGDFNMVPESAEHLCIMQQGLADALALAGFKPHEGVTFPGGGKEPPQRLDYCFLSRNLARRFRRAWIDGAADGSDHQPVWVELN